MQRLNIFTEKKSRRILEAAIELAEKGGFSAVRLRDISEKAQVALGTVYKRFQSKEDILVAALEMQMGEALNQIIESGIDGHTPLQRVISLISNLTQWLCGRPKMAQAIIRAMASGEPELSSNIASFLSRIATFIVGALRGIEPQQWLDSQVLSDLSPAEIQLALLVPQIWFAALVGWSARLNSIEQVTEQVQTATRLLLLGLEQESPSMETSSLSSIQALITPKSK
jgi:AcrR family transcriptional regulator